MISVCIPIYNFHVAALMDRLTDQVEKLPVPCEIIAIDDDSSEAYKELNEKSCSGHTYIQLDKNIGRAKIRNLFLEYATYDHLLFLDCDALIVFDEFLLTYVNAIKQGGHSVICGGRIYPDHCPERKKRLRWKYGIYKESQPLSTRVLSPNKSFMTNNFLIHKKILQDVKFDERITEYGHEDTLFGYRLKKRGIQITHMDNPILNGDIEDNVTYLKKTEEGIVNLIHVLQYVKYDDDFIQDVALLRFHQKVVAKNLKGVIETLFICFKPLLFFLLAKGYINLRLFDFYKLGILILSNKRYAKVSRNT